MEQTKQKPSIGRIVHFYASKDADPQAALVTHVWSDTCVNLVAWNAGGTKTDGSSVLERSDETIGSSWCWPPRA